MSYVADVGKGDEAVNERSQCLTVPCSKLKARPVTWMRDRNVNICADGEAGCEELAKTLGESLSTEISQSPTSCDRGRVTRINNEQHGDVVELEPQCTSYTLPHPSSSRLSALWAPSF